MNKLLVLILTFLCELQNVFLSSFRYKCGGCQIFQKSLFCERIACIMLFNRMVELESIFHCSHSKIPRDLIVFPSPGRLRQYLNLVEINSFTLNKHSNLNVNHRRVQPTINPFSLIARFCNHYLHKSL